MSERPLAGKVAIVTGAGSPIGMGRAMTLALVRAGARVTMTDVNRETLEQSASDARELGGRDSVLPIVADVANPEDAEKTVQRTVAELGGLHILVNNAGTNPRNLELATGEEKHWWEISPEAWTKVVAINFGGPVFMARAAMGHMLTQGWGRIIGVTTSLDTMYRAGAFPYGPSKAGHEAFMALAAQAYGVPGGGSRQEHKKGAVPRPPLRERGKPRLGVTQAAASQRPQAVPQLAPYQRGADGLRAEHHQQQQASGRAPG